MEAPPPSPPDGSPPDGSPPDASRDSVTAAGGRAVQVDEGRQQCAPRRPPSAREIEALVDAIQTKEAESQRFSMWGLLGIVTAASLVLSVGSYLPRSVFAGAVGIATLLSMVALSAMKNPPAVLQVAWWVLLLIYLMSIVSAVWA